MQGERETHLVSIVRYFYKKVYGKGVLSNLVPGTIRVPPYLSTVTLPPELLFPHPLLKMAAAMKDVQVLLPFAPHSPPLLIHNHQYLAVSFPTNLGSA